MTAIVTGASDGIGLETARAPAGAGTRVVYAVRNTAKGHKAAATAPGLTEVRQFDLASLASVNRFAGEWEGPIDLLICNAGVVLPPKPTRTVDGFKVQFGVNHLGHFAWRTFSCRTSPAALCRYRPTPPGSARSTSMT